MLKKGETTMSIAELIVFLEALFAQLMELFGGLFNKDEAEGETPEA